MLEVNVEYPKNPYDPQSDLPFLPEKMKIVLNLHRRCTKLVCNLHNEERKVCCMHKNFNAGITPWISTEKST